MKQNEQLDKRYRSLAWGGFFILVGSLSLIPGDQTSLALLGTGVTMLGLNLARSLSRIAVNGFSIALGAAAFLLRLPQRSLGSDRWRYLAAGVVIAFALVGLYRSVFVPGALAQGPFCLI